MSRASRITVVGAGIVGVRTARELLGPRPDAEVPVGRVTLVSRRPDRLEQLASTFGSSVHLASAEQSEPDLDADVVVVARPAAEQAEVAERALAAGAHVVSTADDPDAVDALLALDGRAERAGRSLVVGAAMSPGLSCLLARHAAALLDEVDEIHVARDGAGGPACARQRLRALRGTASEWRDGAWVRRGGFSGRELCYFPDPIGAHDCYRAALAEPAVLVDAFPGVGRVTSRLAASRLDRALVPLPVLVGPPVEGRPGAVRIEVRGRRAGQREVVVYGVLDRPSVAAAAVAAVAAVSVTEGGVGTGAHGLAAVGDPVPMLRELARRGVRAAVFEGRGGAPGAVWHGENPGSDVQVGPSPADTTTESDI
jgi:hypothetical protein